MPPNNKITPVRWLAGGRAGGKRAGAEGRSRRAQEAGPRQPATSGVWASGPGVADEHLPQGCANQFAAVQLFASSTAADRKQCIPKMRVWHPHNHHFSPANQRGLPVCGPPHTRPLQQLDFHTPARTSTLLQPSPVLPKVPLPLVSPILALRRSPPTHPHCPAAALPRAHQRARCLRSHPARSQPWQAASGTRHCCRTAPTLQAGQEKRTEGVGQDRSAWGGHGGRLSKGVGC